MTLLMGEILISGESLLIQALCMVTWLRNVWIMETSVMYDMLISYVRKYQYGDGDSVSLYLTNLPQAVAVGHFTISSREQTEAPFLPQNDLAFNISSTCTPRYTVCDLYQRYVSERRCHSQEVFITNVYKPI